MVLCSIVTFSVASIMGIATSVQMDVQMELTAADKASIEELKQVLLGAEESVETELTADDKASIEELKQVLLGKPKEKICLVADLFCYLPDTLPCAGIFVVKKIDEDPDWECFFPAKEVGKREKFDRDIWMNKFFDYAYDSTTEDGIPKEGIKHNYEACGELDHAFYEVWTAGKGFHRKNRHDKKTGERMEVPLKRLSDSDELLRKCPRGKESFQVSTPNKVKHGLQEALARLRHEHEEQEHENVKSGKKSVKKPKILRKKSVNKEGKKSLG